MILLCTKHRAPASYSYPVVLATPLSPAIPSHQQEVESPQKKRTFFAVSVCPNLETGELFWLSLSLLVLWTVHSVKAAAAMGNKNNSISPRDVVTKF